MMRSGRWEVSRLGSCDHNRYAENPRRLILFFMRLTFLSNGILISLLERMGFGFLQSAPRFRLEQRRSASAVRFHGGNQKSRHSDPNSSPYPTDAALPLRKNAHPECREKIHRQWSGLTCASEYYQSASGWSRVPAQLRGTKLCAVEYRHRRTPLLASRAARRPPSAKRSPATGKPPRWAVGPRRPSPSPRSDGRDLRVLRDRAAVRPSRQFRPRAH